MSAKACASTAACARTSTVQSLRARFESVELDIGEVGLYLCAEIYGGRVVSSSPLTCRGGGSTWEGSTRTVGNGPDTPAPVRRKHEPRRLGGASSLCHPARPGEHPRSTTNRALPATDF